jgi:hypothetical protein
LNSTAPGLFRKQLKYQLLVRKFGALASELLSPRNTLHGWMNLRGDNMADDSGSSAILGVLVGALILGAVLFFVFGGLPGGNGGGDGPDINVEVPTPSPPGGGGGGG